MKYLSTYKLFESVNQADQIALQEVYGAEAVMSFEFNRENITDTDAIKDLITKYNYYCIKEESWGGGPQPKGFIDFFNKK